MKRILFGLFLITGVVVAFESKVNAQCGYTSDPSVNAAVCGADRTSDVLYYEGLRREAINNYEIHIRQYYGFKGLCEQGNQVACQNMNVVLQLIQQDRVRLRQLGVKLQ